MAFAVKLRTGFYETTLYHFSVERSQVLLTASGDKACEVIIIPESCLIAIYLTKKKHPGIEIQAERQSFIGSFVQPTDLREVLHQLQQYVNTRIICEEE